MITIGYKQYPCDCGELTWGRNIRIEPVQHFGSDTPDYFIRPRENFFLECFECGDRYNKDGTKIEDM